MASTSTPTAAPKAMSSRLLTMKFMQRAAATPTSASPSTPEEPPNKRRKKDSDSTPPTFDVNALANNKAVQKALADEEVIRQAAVERAAAEAGDTRWVLSFEDDERSYKTPAVNLRVVQTGFANLDSLAPPQPLQTTCMDEEHLRDNSMVVGRRSFGRFKKGVEKQQDPSAENISESESELDSDGEDSEDVKVDSSEDADSDGPTSALIKASRKEAAQRENAERKKKKKGQKRIGEELAKQGRKKKEVNLNGLTSLSGDKSFSPAKGPCYNCGGPHMKANCPQSKRLHPGGDTGRPGKALRTR